VLHFANVKIYKASRGLRSSFFHGRIWEITSNLLRRLCRRNLIQWENRGSVYFRCCCCCCYEITIRIDASHLTYIRE